MLALLASGALATSMALVAVVSRRLAFSLLVLFSPALPSLSLFFDEVACTLLWLFRVGGGVSFWPAATPTQCVCVIVHVRAACLFLSLYLCGRCLSACVFIYSSPLRRLSVWLVLVGVCFFLPLGCTPNWSVVDSPSAWVGNSAG